VNDKKITLGKFGVSKGEDLTDLNEYIQAADVIVYEGFWLRPDKAMKGDFNWQQIPAEKAIGSLLTLCKLNGKTNVVRQQASQRVPGYAFAGLTYVPKAKGKHWQDALSHAVYYAVKVLNANPVRTP
jgi:hypothetical protein